jgi:hypothetical protein
MKTTTMTAENSTEVVEKVRNMLSNETAINFDFNLGSDFFDPQSHKQSRLSRTSSGYNYIDLCLKGGYWGGSLIVFLSGPKYGKCVEKNTMIRIKNKKTGVITTISMIDFFNNIKKFFGPAKK